MQTVQSIYSRFRENLLKYYELEEAEQITVLSFGHAMNFRRIDISTKKDEAVNGETILEFDRILSSLESGMPIQYVLGKTWFHGMELMVNKNVLIPRRETEELIEWIVRDNTSKVEAPTLILDICTGSGCIALALKKEFSDAKVIAVDNSGEALEVAKYNTKNLSLPVDLVKMDALRLTFDVIPNIIVSNPPYVLQSEKELMDERVVSHEPPEALFVPDEDPLVFYRHISSFAFDRMETGGQLFFEINERYGKNIRELLSDTGFQSVEVRKDMQEKYRMIKAIKK